MVDHGPAGARKWDPGPTCHLVIMVREPVAGRAKTRLAREIGTPSAMRFYRHTLAAVVSRLSRDPRWQTSLSVAPATAIASRGLPSGVARAPQSTGDLGHRMQQIFGPPGAQLHNQPVRSSATVKRHGPVIIVGTDIPEVRPGHIAAAFRALGNHDMVYGPATDGGFWLVGMRRTPRIRDAFRNIRWSTSETLEDCLLGMTGSRVATVATLRDVDDLSDMRALGGAIGRFLLPASSAATSEATRAAQFRAVDTG